MLVSRHCTLDDIHGGTVEQPRGLGRRRAATDLGGRRSTDSRGRPAGPASAHPGKLAGVPEQILTDNGKVFTGRFGPGPGPVRFDRICVENGIRHLLTAPYSPTTTGKVERLHKTMRAEFFRLHEREFVGIAELQAALDGWVVHHNTERPHQSVGMCPPADRFRLAARDRVVAVDAAADAPAESAEPVATPLVSTQPRSPGVGRWVRPARPGLGGRIQLSGGGCSPASSSTWWSAAAWWRSCTPAS